MRPAGPNRGFFDAWSRIYDATLVQRATYRPVHNAVLAELREEPPGLILDVGCGTGLLAARMLSLGETTRVVGCDFSTGMLRQASARAHLEGQSALAARARWVRGDGMRLPFRDAVFDAVVSTEAFHWFPDQDAALREFQRVLAPGGRLLLELVAAHHARLSDFFHLGSRWAGEPFYWPTRDRLRAQLEAAGLRVERQRRVYRLAGFLLPPVLTVARRPRTV